MEVNAYGTAVLGRVLDVAALRHRVISQNVANVNTPGYRRLEVTFEDEFARALAAPTGATPPVLPQVVEGDGPERVDGNNVDMDREMNALAKNALLYNTAAQVAASRLAMLRAAIAGR
jgi:flagellar basal-body rod protein FlgB